MTPVEAEEPCRVTCCVIARGRVDHLRRVLAGLRHQTTAPHEVVVVSMGDPRVASVASTDPVVSSVGLVEHELDGPLPLARARNAAARRADGDVLVFLDVDCIPAPELVADYLRQQRPGLLMGTVRHLPPGVPSSTGAWSVRVLREKGRLHPARPRPSVATQTSRYELFWSLNFAVQRETWRALGGFDERYDGYGGEDTDLAFEARDRGIPAWFVAGAEAFHQHHPVEDPPVEHLHDIVANARRFHAKWRTWPMTGWLESFADLGLIDWTEDTIALVPGGDRSRR